MTEKAKAYIDKQLEDLNDTVHDMYCTLREEMNIQILPTDFIKYVRLRFMQNLLETAQDLTDEFDEEVDD